MATCPRLHLSISLAVGMAIGCSADKSAQTDAPVVRLDLPKTGLACRAPKGATASAVIDDTVAFPGVTVVIAAARANGPQDGEQATAAAKEFFQGKMPVRDFQSASHDGGYVLTYSTDLQGLVTERLQSLWTVGNKQYTCDADVDAAGSMAAAKSVCASLEAAAMPTND